MAGIEATTATPTIEAKDSKTDSDTKSKDHHAPAHDDDRKKKRRKVNHACLYCRRSHMTCESSRPCGRCIKRNIGHLCHDEPREIDSKKAKSVLVPSIGESDSQSELERSIMDRSPGSMGPPILDGTLSSRPAKSAFEAATLAPGNPLQLVQPTPVSSIQAGALSSTMGQLPSFSDSWFTSPNHYHDMHNFHSSYAVPEVSNELHLFNEFLHSAMIDDALGDDPSQNTPLGSNPLLAGSNSDPFFKFTNELPPDMQASLMPPPSNAELAKAIGRTKSVNPAEKARDYYLEAADPHGNESPEERMKLILEAKHKAGLLRPFNYVNGYKALQSYLETHVSQTSRNKIINVVGRFRPKFRDLILQLTNMDLILVEMWFERSLLECDRLFASMAIPACCWRRTGEIFRGNKEMAELIGVPVEQLQGGKIALHQILTEDANVRYWEEFGTIAFDKDHDSLLTSCSVKNPNDSSKLPAKNCCFSFRIRRDEHEIPCLIIGNFLPLDP